MIEIPRRYVNESGVETWLLSNGHWHREDGPAHIVPDEGEFWYWHNKLHRDGGPAITKNSGTKFWYKHGRYHRDDGPAIIHRDGSEEWYRYGELHRTDGPAKTEVGKKPKWFLFGVRMMMPSAFQKYAELTDEEMTILLLKYGGIT